MKTPSKSTFHKWNEVLAAYRQKQYVATPPSSDADYEEEMGMLTLFFDILAHAITGHKAKDKWSDFVMPLPFGQTAIKKSAKHRADYEFGIYHDELYLDTWIIHPRYIRLMPDVFWRTILELGDIGQVRFSPGDHPQIDKGDRYQRELFRSETSPVFTMIRNYVFLMERQRNEYDDISLGRIEISWPVDTPIRETFNRACKAFSGLYRINGLLHRAWFIEFKANMKKHFHSMTSEQQSMYGTFDDFMRLMQPPEDDK